MTKKMAGTLILATFVGGVALAGKPERDMQANFEPVVKDGEKAVAAACGCEVKIDVKWASYPAASDMVNTGTETKEIVGAAQNQCSSPANKKARCDHLKTIEVAFTAAKNMAAFDPSQSGKTVKAWANDTAFSQQADLTKLFDKY